MEEYGVRFPAGPHFDNLSVNNLEGCQSGRMGRTRNAVGLKGPREFESHPLRQKYMFNFSKKEKKEPKNLKEVLTNLRDLKVNVEKIFREIENIKEENKFSVQKVGIIRFNPFQEVGGDQSFSIALLDGNDDGVVITSHYTRSESRIYGKPVKAGKSEYILSEEEKRAIEKARSNKKDTQ